jgi:hypothetical protein
MANQHLAGTRLADYERLDLEDFRPAGLAKLNCEWGF